MKLTNQKYQEIQTQTHWSGKG